jgi:hypothetical protein
VFYSRREGYFGIYTIISHSRITLNTLNDEQHQGIETYLDARDTRVYSQRGIEEILARNWNLWHFPLSMTMPGLLDHLIKHSKLKKAVLKSPNYDKEIVRYAWREISVYQLGLSLRPRSYLSHYSAMLLNNSPLG